MSQIAKCGTRPNNTQDNMTKKILASFYLLLFSQVVWAQNPFDEEVAQIQKKYKAAALVHPPIVFTGSSSVRMWPNLKDLAPAQRVLNTGFGGSQARDLLHFKEKLILQYKPKQVFIYEGDNDLFAGQSPRSVLRRTKRIFRAIKRQNKNTKVVLIAAKPSISRWHLKEKYLRLNRLFKQWAAKKQQIGYADIWSPMLKDGKLIKSLFISDGLHMNEDGYKIWEGVISPMVLK